MATHSSILAENPTDRWAWRTTDHRSQGIRYDWGNLASTKIINDEISNRIVAFPNILWSVASFFLLLTVFFMEWKVFFFLSFHFVLGYTWFAVVVSGEQPRDSAINVQKTHLKNNCHPKYTKNFQNWTIRKQPNLKMEISPVVQGPRLCPSNAVYVGSIPNKGTRIPCVIWHSKKEIPARLLYCSSPDHGSPPAMDFSRQEYWSGWPCLPPGHLPDSGIEPRSPVLQVDSLPSEAPGNPTKRRVAFLI